MTLKEFVKQEGSTAIAAKKIGVSDRTIRRVLAGESKPSRMLVLLLKALQIEVF